MTIPTDELELLKLRKDIWAKAVDTQMHFNEMCGKSRQLGLSFVVAALGIAVVLLSKDTGPVLVEFTALGRHIAMPAAGAVVFIAAAGLFAVKTLDLNVYHQMLRGAVAFGEEFERVSMREPLMQTALGMTETISFYSRNENATKTVGSDGKAKFEVKDPPGIQFEIEKSTPTTAATKIAKFYNLGITGLLLIAIVLCFVFGDMTPVQKNGGSGGGEITSERVPGQLDTPGKNLE